MNRRNKTITIVALIIAIASLTIGFAAFSSTLTISSGATVTPNSDTFKVKFVGDIECVAEGSASIISSGSLTNTSVSGISVKLQAPFDKVTCTVKTQNVGEYVAYLNSITTDKVMGCTKAEGSSVSDELLYMACTSIGVNVEVEGETSIFTVNESVISNANYTNHGLNKTATDTMKIIIDYFDDYRADGPIELDIPTINFNYSSVG